MTNGGTGVRVCQADGTWTGSNAVCAEKSMCTAVCCMYKLSLMTFLVNYLEFCIKHVLKLHYWVQENLFMETNQ